MQTVRKVNGNLRREVRGIDERATMTRKDYILLARALQTEYRTAGVNLETKEDASTLQGIEIASFAIASALASDNPRFDREHFLAVVRGEKDINSRPKNTKCKACRNPEHDTCSMTIGCPCCNDTIRQMAEQG